ncbi:MAG: hypothetical protein PSV13_20125 [Lacunisphaera sp.]|nr:hypothetical protein [Lacunisphaera sp.]
MTTARSTIIPSGGNAAGSGLTRLKMGDAIYTSHLSPDSEAGQRFIIIQRGEYTPLPRPRGPRRLGAGRTG